MMKFLAYPIAGDSKRKHKRGLTFSSNTGTIIANERPASLVQGFRSPQTMYLRRPVCLRTAAFVWAIELLEAHRPLPSRKKRSGGGNFYQSLRNHVVERELEAGCCIWRGGVRLPI